MLNAFIAKRKATSLPNASRKERAKAKEKERDEKEGRKEKGQRQ